MVLQVKNSRLLLFNVSVIAILFGLVYSKKFSIASQTYNENFGEGYESVVRDSLIRFCYGLKSSLDTVEVNKDVTIIGIDDETSIEYGKFGGPLWSLKEPYSSLFHNLQKHFPPSCVSVDLILAKDQGKILDENHIKDISENSGTIMSLSKKLKTYSEEFESVDTLNLLKLSTFVSEQGVILFSEVLGQVAEPLDEKQKKLRVILGYSLEEDNGFFSEKINFDNKDFYKWTDEDVLGTDPEDLNEEYGGELIPYLKKTTIPNENIFNVPDEFVYLPYGNFASPLFMDFTDNAHINVRRDQDGVVRRAPLVLATKYYNSLEKKLKTIYLPSFALLSCINHWGADMKDVKVYFGDRVEITLGETVKRIPIDKYGRMLLNFNFKPKDMNYISFSRINEFGAGLSKNGEEAFEGEFKNSLKKMREFLIGKICVVGLTFTGNPDVGPTTIDSNTSLVYVHATAVNSILSENYLCPAGDRQIYFNMLLIFIVLGAGSVLMSLTGFTVLFFITQVAIAIFSVLGIYYSWFYLPTLFLLTYCFVLFIMVVLYRYFSEEKEKYKIRKMFSTMVSPSVLDYMEANPESFSLTGSKMSATIMFSDVAGFTSISEGLPPERLVLLLNKYLTPMTDIIQSSGGYVDKYEGDAVMAEWGVPFANEKHATLACYACLDQQKKLDEIRESLYKEFGYRLEVRIGVNSGEVSAGNMGSNKHFSYTVMGDAVNLAARLEPTNKVYGTKIMIGEKTFNLAKDDIEARLLDKVVVVGKKEAIRVYELLARKGELSEDQLKSVKHYENGLELHEERKWNEAVNEFKKALEINAGDKAAQVMIERIEEYKVNPPGPEWQGEYIRKSKD